MSWFKNYLISFTQEVKDIVELNMNKKSLNF